VRVLSLPARHVLAALGLVATAAFAAPTALAGGSIGMIVLKEHAVGSTTTAQPYLDKLMGIAAKENGWAAGGGSFQTSRGNAETWIAAEKPHYGIVSLAAFLAFKDKYKLETIGQAVVSGGGGQQYFVVSSTAGDLAGCKGKRLATDHADDPRFVEKVVAAGDFKLADFTLVATKRPGEAGRKVISGDAECALIDDAQVAQLAGVTGGAAVKQVWKSAAMPPMAIVAFPDAAVAERTAFQASLPKICGGANKEVCDQVGLQSLAPSNAGAYAAVVALYNKP
jgi:hypothetical protein